MPTSVRSLISITHGSAAGAALLRWGAMAGELTTVVFVDVAGSTELLGALGDEDGTRAIDAALAVAWEKVSSYEGRVVKSLGDGLMLTFRSPRSAVAFAVAVQHAAPSRPRLRVGMNFGEVAGDDPRGEVVNAAARIGDRAAGGEILVSDIVARLAGPMPGVRFVDRGRVALKGFRDRWQLHAVMAAAERRGAVPVFGRHDELSRLDEMVTAAAAGSGRAVLIEGEAGIGKSHLASSIEARARTSGFIVAVGGADELDQDRPGRVLSALSSTLGVPLGELAPGASPKEGPAGDPAYAVVERFVDLVEDHAAARPVLLVAEDLHWADELSLRGLAAVLRRVGTIGLAVVATARPAPRPPGLARIRSLFDGQQFCLLPLGGLDATAVAGMVAALTGGAPGPALTGRLAATGGNPLFVSELIRALDETDALRIESGIAEATSDELPESLVAALARRIAALPEVTAGLVRVASLLGSRFSLEELSIVAGQPVVEVAADLRPAVDAALIVGDGNHLTFRHDLVREAVAAELTPAIRTDLHAAAGRGLAAAGAPAARVANQFALGARPGDLTAVEWLMRAADEASHLDTAAAVGYLERALELAPPAWPGRTVAEARLVELLAWIGRADDARGLAGALLDRSVSPAEEAAGRRALAAVLATVGELDAAADQLEKAVAVDGEDGNVLRCAAAGMRVISGTIEPAVARTLATQFVDASRPDLACWARNTLAVAAVAEGRYDEMLDHARIASGLLERTWTAPLGFLIPHAWLGAAHYNVDDFDGAARAAAQTLALGERRGDVGLVLHALALQVGLSWTRGEWDDAAAVLTAAFDLTEETNVGVHLLFFHGVAALIALARGDRQAAEAHCDAGDAIWGRGGRHPFGLDVLTAARAELLEVDGDDAGALALLRAMWDQTAGLRGLIQWRTIAPRLARLARLAEDHGTAQAVADSAGELAARTSSRSAGAAAARARAYADDDVDLAVAAALDLDATGRVVDAAATREEAAQMLLAADRLPEARPQLEEAAGLHARTGATAHLARVDALLREMGVRRRRSSPGAATSGWDALSPKELEVVTLVAEGLSNPQIGERLFISRRTVESHLSHVFTKLDLSNRTQLAAAVIDRGLA